MKIFDTQFAHAVSAGTPYQDTKLPFVWERGFESYSTSEFLIFTESDYQKSKNINHDKKVLWVLESPFMIPDYLIQDIINNHHSFHTILSHDDRLLHLSNATKFPIGGCWIYPNDAKVYEKEALTISTITSNKLLTEGHILRHQISKNTNIQVYGPNYIPLNYKLEALKSFQFHICIENVKSKNAYFTEKIIDCFATGTIPIYWGCGCISDFFNTKGVIEVDNLEELNYCLDNLEHFQINKEAIQENFDLSKTYWLPENRILSIFV